MERNFPMILPIAAFVIAKSFDYAPRCVVDLLFGPEDVFEYKGSTTPE